MSKGASLQDHYHLVYAMQIRFESDIVTARKKTRRLSGLLGFDSQDQVRLATAVSELARNIYKYASSGRIEFFFAEVEQTIFVRFTDSGPGIQELDSILNGTYVSKSGMGVGIIGSKKIMDSFEIVSVPGQGTQITLSKKLDRRAPSLQKKDLVLITHHLAKNNSENPFEEIQNQNRDLINSLEQLNASQEELNELNRELAETNRGVVALYAELDEKAKALERADQAKTSFLSNMSHEIRTPLGVIQGFADLALDSEILESERQEYLITIKRNAFNLTKLLGEILDLAKIESGNSEIEKTRFSLPDLVSDIIKALSLQAREKGVALEFVIDGQFPEFVKTDAIKLRQVLINLLSNALKFTHKGRVQVCAKVSFSMSKIDPVYIEFTVSDTGIGLTPKQQSRLFGAFMQADSSTTRRFGGTGLGLHLSKKLIQSLGGDLILESSQSEKGSVFKFNFDAGVLSEQDFVRRAEGSGDSLLLASRTADELKDMSILLVEDSIDNQRLFTRYLKKTGAIVHLACDGVEGVSMAEKYPYDAILMDVQMPNLDGYGATQILRAAGLQTPIIALTAHALKEEREHALTQGFSNYLTKPLDPVLLVEVLRQYQKNSSTDGGVAKPI